MKSSSVTCVLIMFLISGCLCAVLPELFKCTKGVHYIENRCSNCQCVGDNELVCNLRRCSEKLIKESENCDTGATWTEKCNKCWCTNAGTVCTNRKCEY